MQAKNAFPNVHLIVGGETDICYFLIVIELPTNVFDYLITYIVCNYMMSQTNLNSFGLIVNIMACLL